MGKRRNAFQTGAKIELNEKKILGLWALKQKIKLRLKRFNFSLVFAPVQVFPAAQSHLPSEEQVTLRRTIFQQEE